MLRCLTAGAAALMLISLPTASAGDAPPLPSLPDAVSRHADEIAAKQAAFERAIQLGHATPKAWAPVPEPSPIDVLHYDLDLNVDPGTRTLSGTARVELAAVDDGVTVVQLDTDLGLRVLAVVLLADARFPADSPRSLPFGHADDRLSVQLPRPLAAGDTIELLIPYGGRASRAGDGLNWSTHRGVPEIFTFAEPFGARVWFPCNDRPDDKATVDLTVTAPEALTVASNGLETDRVDHGDGTATTTWSSRYPVATYLVVMNISDYEYREWTYETQDGSTMPVVAYMYPEAAAAGEVDLAITPEMIRVLGTRFEEYPFVEEKYGNLTAAFGGGMEHQTLTTIGNFFGDPWMEWLNVHELTHQWWGDWVTCADWRELWLNESFATYGEFVWAEEHHGAAYLDQYRLAADELQFFAGPLYDNPVPFSRTIYDGGAVRLHMLRYVVGDDAFFAGLRAFRAAFAGGAGTTEGFRTAMESASGMELGWFFDQWVYGANRPRFQYEWEAVSGPAVRLTVTQEHSNAPYFRTPMDVLVQTTAGPETHRIELEAEAGQTLTIPVAASPTGVVLDPDSRILSHLSPASEPDIDFGPDFPDLDAGQVHGTETATIVIPITNVGGADLVISNIHSSSASRFRIASPTEYPVTLAAGESVDLTIEFQSASPGAQSAWIYVFNSDPSYPEGVAYVPVAGRGAAFEQPRLQAPASASAGDVPLGGVGETSIRLLNFGAEPLAVAGVLAGDAFTLGSPIPAEIPGGGSAMVYVRFQPEMVGEAIGTLTLATNDPDRPSHVITLSGDGVGAPRLEVEPRHLDLGVVAAGSSSLLRLANSGTADLVVAGAAVEGPFSVPDAVTSPVAIAPGGSLDIPVSVSGGVAGALRGSLTVRSNDPSLPRAEIVLSAFIASDPLTIEGWAFPAAASTPGIGGARWSSTAVLLNPSDHDMVVDLSFRPAVSRDGSDLTLAVPAGEQRTVVDVVAAAGQTGAGALAMDASAAGLVAVSRTFSSEQGGTYGQLIPAVAASAASTGDRTLVIPGLAGNGGFRTNIGAYNLSDEPLELTYELHAADGSALGSDVLAIPPHAHAQHNRVLAAVTSDVIRSGYAVLQADTAGARFAAYGSVVDDASHDPTLVLPVDVGEPGLRRIVPVVASNPGAAQTMWRSDVSVANLSDAPVTVAVRLHQAGTVHETTVEIPAVAAIELADVVRSTFARTGSGWLELESSGPGLAATSRTYNDAATGTYGQHVPAVAESEAAATDEVLVLAGLTSEDGFRTNLGLTSVADTAATVLVRVYRDTGELLGELPVMLPAGHFVQVQQILADELGYTGAAWATLSTDDPGARFLAHASVVDGTSGDPIYIPAQRLIQTTR